MTLHGRSATFPSGKGWVDYVGRDLRLPRRQLPPPQTPPPMLASTIVAEWWASDLALNDGDPVSSWTDRIGGVTLTNTLTARPTYRSAHIGGRPAVDFDGSNDVLWVSNQLSNSTLGTVVAIVLVDTTSGSRGVWSSGDEASASRYLLGTSSTSASGGTGRISFEAANGGALSPHLRGNTTTLSTATPYLLEWSSVGASHVLRVNGVEQSLVFLAGTANGRWFGGVTARDSFALGALKFNGTATAYFDGAIAYLAVFNEGTQFANAGLITDDRAAILAWARAHYGIAT